MSKIVVSDPLGEQMQAADNVTEICNERGTIIGFFQPVWLNQEFQKQMAGRCPYTKEELESFRKEGGGTPLGDLFARLERENPA